MSGDKESNVLKGGHAPAQKVAGGVRRTRKSRLSSESERNQKKPNGLDTPQESYDEELEEQSKNVLAHSGLVAKTNKDYPEEAVRAYHNKQMPQLQKPTKNPNIILFQPSKQ
uniref:Uncharacterized protein n=1 Tax=Setaria digitata TaxID=48799 RepID=A0A915PZA2_9BILA